MDSKVLDEFNKNTTRLLSTPCNGFYGEFKRIRVAMKAFFQLHVMDSMPETPFRIKALAYAFQLHVMDSKIPELRALRRKFYLSTPCNGFWIRDLSVSPPTCQASFNSM